MLVVLAITSVVAGLAFSIMSLFGRNIQNIQQNYSAHTSLQLLEQQLAVDINSYPSVEYNHIEKTLALKSPIDSVRYQFKNSTILRQTDTIFNNDLFTEFYFLGKKVEKGQVDAIKINVETTSEGPFIFISKRNSAKHFLLANGN